MKDKDRVRSDCSWRCSLCWGTGWEDYLHPSYPGPEGQVITEIQKHRQQYMIPCRGCLSELSAKTKKGYSVPEVPEVEGLNHD